jgi:hypothetical protein
MYKYLPGPPDLPVEPFQPVFSTFTPTQPLINLRKEDRNPQREYVATYSVLRVHRRDRDLVIYQVTRIDSFLATRQPVSCLFDQLAILVATRVFDSVP